MTGYVGLPFKKGSPFLPSIENALVKLRQSGVVNEINAEFKRHLKLKELDNCDAGVRNKTYL